MLSAGRNTVEIAGDQYLVLPVKAGTTIYEGALVALDAGFAIPGKVATALIAAGRAESFVDNSTGAGGDKTVTVKRGVFKYNNDTTNAVAATHVLKDCYIKDDETVSSNATGTSVAGKVLAIGDGGDVIVEIR